MILSGYEPADLTVQPPPPRTAEGGFIFFRLFIMLLDASEHDPCCAFGYIF